MSIEVTAVLFLISFVVGVFIGALITWRLVLSELYGGESDGS